MNWNLVWAVVIRHFYNFRHSLDRVADAFYWPAMDIFLWGFTSLYIAQHASNLSNITIMLLSGLILWMIVFRGQYEITVNLLEEMWNNNLVNMFASPLRLREWLAGVFLLGFIKLWFIVGFASIVAYFIYKANIYSLGFYFIPFAISLLLTGWGIGMLVASAIIYYGGRIQVLAWSGISLLTPFSGVFYPISTLPNWAQIVASVIPTSYIFEGMREILFKGTLSLDLLIKSFLINIVLLILGLTVFVFAFQKSKIKGLHRHE